MQRYILNVKKMKFIIIVVVLCLSINLQSQQIKRITLCDELDETSALMFLNGSFWTINDSGGENAIYQIDTSGKLLHKTIIKNAVNVDWEALTMSEKYILVGDVGNNYGNRQNLKIYLVDKLNITKPQASISGVIEYKYEKQTMYLKNKLTQFDCEAILVKDTTVLLFTKDWKNRQGALYTLPLKCGKYDAKYIQELNAKGLITDAAWSMDTIYLSGYYNYTPVIWKYLYLPSNKLRLISRNEFPKMYKWQVEGISICNSTIYLTSEKSRIKQSLIKFN